MKNELIVGSKKWYSHMNMHTKQELIEFYEVALKEKAELKETLELVDKHLLNKGVE